MGLKGGSGAYPADSGWKQGAPWTSQDDYKQNSKIF